MRRLTLNFILTLFLSPSLLLAHSGQAAGEFVVYSVYRNLDLGNSDDPPQKDYYVNMGKMQGLQEGTTLEVRRRISTYDLLSEQLYKDITFPIALIKVIHVEPTAAVARLQRMFAFLDTPATTPRAVMVGDLVLIAPFVAPNNEAKSQK